MSYNRYQEHIERLKSIDNYRIFRETISLGKKIEYKNESLLNCSSNDYLGLSADNTLWNEFISTYHVESNSFIPSACSSRLLTGNSKEYTILENLLSTLFQREAALIFNSGYHANIGILPALSNKNDLILADKLVHASIIDGLKLCDAKVIRYKHNDLQQVDDLLATQRNRYDNVFIVTESIFSMDGDVADIEKLVDLKTKHNAFLYIDEAHAFGAAGKKGLGLIEECSFIQSIDFIVGTFGKAAISQGAYLVCNQVIKDYLINTMRSLIFTTALPPVNIAWTTFIIQKLVEMNEAREKLKQISRYFRTQLEKHHFHTLGISQIIPVITGSNESAVQLSNYLQEHGIFVLPVRPPTVPAGSARLRFSLNATFNKSDIDQIVQLLINWKDDTKMDC